MAIAGSSDNQNQQLRDIIRSLESLNGSIKDTFDVQKNLLEAFSESNSSATKNLASIKDTMERQQKAISAYISAMRSSGVVSTAGPQVDATAALMSSSKLKTNAAADAETAKVMDIIKEHTKQMIESAKNAEISSEKMNKLIGVLEKHTLSNETLKKFIEDVKNGKKFTSEAFYGKEVEGLSKAERSRLDASTSKLVNSIAESNKIASLEYDEREKRDDLDRLQKESDTALLEIRDALLSGKVEVKEKTERVRSKYETNVVGTKTGTISKQGKNQNIPTIIPSMPDTIKTVGSILMHGLRIGTILISAKLIKEIVEQWKKYKKLDKLLEVAADKGLPPEVILTELQRAGFLLNATLEGEQIKNYVRMARAQGGKVNKTTKAAKSYTSGMENLFFDSLGLFERYTGFKSGWLNDDGTAKPMNGDPAKTAAVAGFAGFNAATLPVMMRPFGGNAMMQLGSNAMRLGGQGLMRWGVNHAGSRFAERAFDLGAKMTDKAGKFGKFGGGFNAAMSRAALMALVYYSIKTGQEIIANMGEFQNIVDDVQNDENNRMRKAYHWSTLMPKKMWNDIHSHIFKESQGFTSSGQEILAFFKFKVVREFFSMGSEILNIYQKQFGGSGEDIGFIGAFTGNVRHIQNFQNKIQILSDKFRDAVVKAEDTDAVLKLLDEYTGKLKELTIKAYEARGNIKAYSEDIYEEKWDYYDQKLVRKLIHRRGEAIGDQKLRDRYLKAMGLFENRRETMFSGREGMQRYAELYDKSNALKAMVNAQGEHIIEKNGLIDPSSIYSDVFGRVFVNTKSGNRIQLSSDAQQLLISQEDVDKYGKSSFSHYYRPASDNREVERIRRNYVLNQKNVNVSKDNTAKVLTTEPVVKLQNMCIGT